jgi:hypothetical protein
VPKPVIITAPIRDWKQANQQILQLQDQVNRLQTQLTSSQQAAPAPAFTPSIQNLLVSLFGPPDISTGDLGAPSLTTLNGTTSGTFLWVEPFVAPSFKLFLGIMEAYKNASGVSQTVTYPTPFINDPSIIPLLSGVSTTKTVLTLPNSMVSTQTQVFFVAGA